MHQGRRLPIADGLRRRAVRQPVLTVGALWPESHLHSARYAAGQNDDLRLHPGLRGRRLCRVYTR